MTRQVFEVDKLPENDLNIPPQNPLAETMFAVEKFVRDSLGVIQRPAEAFETFDMRKALADISIPLILEIPNLRRADISPAKDFFDLIARSIQINIQRNFTRIQALNAGHIPDAKRYGEGNWSEVLTRWRFLYELKKIIREEFLPALEGILSPPSAQRASSRSSL